QMCLRDWCDDVERCARLLHATAGDVPLVLWGVRAGALLAAEVFASGVGDASLLVAPIGGRAMLSEALRRVLIADMLARTSVTPWTREEIIARFERGDMGNIEGYTWTRKLWDDSESHPLPTPPVGEPRPWRILDFKGAAATPLPPELLSMRESVNENRFWESS